MQASVSKRVCVTGATGFLGLWTTRMLLNRGYKVHATARSERKAKMLTPHTNLTVFTGCDLMIKGSFDKAIEGCDVVLHTASPFFWKGSEEELVAPALKGTENVLEACKKFGVSQVVVTSSTASVYTWYGTKPKEYVYSSKDFSPEDMCRQNKDFYSLSKLLAEKKAWEMAEGNFQMSTINPALIFGPLLPEQKEINTSTQAILDYISGKKSKIANKCTNIVDVRDVALAHILVFEKQAWNERFLIISGCPHWKEIIKTAALEVPGDYSKLPTEVEDITPTVYGAPHPHPSLIDVTPSKEKLGLEYIPMEESIRKNVRTALERSFAIA